MDPLSNPLILSNIFEHLPLDGKKSFRQVSQLWEDSTLQSWRDNALVKIVNEKLEENSKGVPLKEFVELLMEEAEKPYRFSERKPFRRFQLRGCRFHCPPYKIKEDEWPKIKNMEITGPRVGLLLEKIGPTIHHLQLDSNVAIGTGRIVDVFKWILLKACVNLKELHIGPIVIEAGLVDPLQPLFQPGDLVQEKALNLVTLKRAYLSLLPVPDEEARELWKIIPNVKNLDLNKHSRQALKLIKQLKHPLDSGKFIQLERLKLQSLPSDKATTNEVEQLVELTNYIKAAKPPLTKICLKLNPGKLRNAHDSFKCFLESCKDTLISLSVWLNEEDVGIQSEPNEWIVELSGVTLPNLTCLYFQYGNAAHYNRVRNGTRSFDFEALQGFPKLKKLTVQIYGYDETVNENFFGRTRWLTEEKLQDRKVDEVQFGDDVFVRNGFLEDFTFWSFQKFDCESLKKLAGWMPSIKYLAVDADETTLPVILNLFSDLKRLSLLSGSYVSRNTLQKVKTTYPGIEIDVLGFNQSLTKCEMPEYF